VKGGWRFPLRPLDAGVSITEKLMKSIMLIVPVYNEESSIMPFLSAVSEILWPLEERGYYFEFLFVNDGSKDDTLKILLETLAYDERVQVIDLSRNFGKEAAMTAGIDAANGDAVIPIDVDLQDPPGIIEKMIEKWEQGAEVVLAHRHDRIQDSFIKRKTARWFYKIHNIVSQPQIPEDVGDYRLLDRTVVEALKKLPERKRFMKGLYSWVGFKTATVEYERHQRITGESKFSVWKLWNFALEGITSFSTVPLQIWTYLGLLISLLSFFYMLYIISRTIVHGIDVPGYASLLVTILFLGGIQLIGIGVLGEYLGRVYTEVKQRPTYIIRKKYSKEVVGGSSSIPTNVDG
jgi:polyisoprenyl-phosphate glycosyltransferase